MVIEINGCNIETKDIFLVNPIYKTLSKYTFSLRITRGNQSSVIDISSQNLPELTRARSELVEHWSGVTNISKIKFD